MYYAGRVTVRVTTEEGEEILEVPGHLLTADSDPVAVGLEYALDKHRLRIERDAAAVLNDAKRRHPSA